MRIRGVAGVSSITVLKTGSKSAAVVASPGETANRVVDAWEIVEAGELSSILGEYADASADCLSRSLSIDSGDAGSVTVAEISKFLSRLLANAITRFRSGILIPEI